MEIILTYLRENGAELIPVVVGSFAILIYILQNRTTKINAAKIIVLQIMDIQLKLNEFDMFIIGKSMNTVGIYESTPIIMDNQWDKYKQILVKKISSDDYREIENFYQIAEVVNAEQETIKQLEKESFYIKQKMMYSWECEVIKEILKDQDIEKLKGEFASKKRDIAGVFSMDIWTDYMPEQNHTTLEKIFNKYKHINISTNQGFIKMKKIAKI